MHSLHFVALVGKIVAITREVIESTSFSPHEKEYLILHRLGLIVRGDAYSNKNDLEMCRVPPMEIAHLRAMVQQESGASYERMCLLKTLALFSLDPKDSGLEVIGKQNGEPDVYLYFLRTAADEKLIKTLRSLVPDEAINANATELGEDGIRIPSEPETTLLTLEAEIKLRLTRAISDARLAKAIFGIHEAAELGNIDDSQL